MDVTLWERYQRQLKRLTERYANGWKGQAHGWARRQDAGESMEWTILGEHRTEETPGCHSEKGVEPVCAERPEQERVAPCPTASREVGFAP